MAVRVEGQTAAGFEPVARTFERLVGRREGGGALSVRLRGETVVDLWAGYADRGRTRPWTPETLAISFSTTKGVASTIIHRLADRGELRYNEPVASYWPEFAAGGKERVTVRHLLTHQRSAPERVLGAAAELAAATGVNGMVGGQYADVSPHTPPGAAALRRLHELKTGRLIGASVLCVLLLGGIPDGPATSPFRRFATEMGVLFQIVDDILDVTGTDAALGKPRGSDERHGKRTYVSEYGIDRARELAAESHAAARRALAEAAAPVVMAAGGAAGGDGARATAELEQIVDFIYTRTS